MNKKQHFSFFVKCIARVAARARLHQEVGWRLRLTVTVGATSTTIAPVLPVLPPARISSIRFFQLFRVAITIVEATSIKLVKCTQV